MPTRKPNSVPWIGVAVLAVLIGAYVGAYCAIVNPQSIGQFPVRQRDGRIINREYRMPYYWNDNGGLVVTFFTPIHWLDQRLRPDIWGPRS